MALGGLGGPSGLIGGSSTDPTCAVCGLDPAEVGCVRLSCETCCHLTYNDNPELDDCQIHLLGDDAGGSRQGGHLGPVVGVKRNRKETYDKLIAWAATKGWAPIPIFKPFAVFCPLSLVCAEIKIEGKGAERFQEKTESWLTQKEKFPEAHEVKSLTAIVVEILSSRLVHQYPIDFVQMLMQPVKRYMSIVLVRKTLGTAGMGYFEGRTEVQQEVPAMWQPQLAATHSFVARGRGRGRYGGYGGGRGGGRWGQRWGTAPEVPATAGAAGGAAEAAGAGATTAPAQATRGGGGGRFGNRGQRAGQALATAAAAAAAAQAAASAAGGAAGGAGNGLTA